MQYLQAGMIDTLVELFEETDVEGRPRRASIQLSTEILTNKRGISAKWTPRLLGHSPVCYKSRGWKVQGTRLARDTTETQVKVIPSLLSLSRFLRKHVLTIFYSIVKIQHTSL